jgi:hypothetical protein
VSRLSGAERARRAAALGALFAGLVAQSLWPVAAIEAVAEACVAPVSAVLAPLAGGLASGGHPLDVAESDAEPLRLVEAERRQGRPLGTRGSAWLEVPVLRHDRASGRLILVAGSGHGLAEGQAVVFGSLWLGRVREVEAETAVVELWWAPGSRTGVTLEGGDEVSLRSVCVGRGLGKSAMVGWLEPGPDPRVGIPVHWRLGPDDPPSLARRTFLLGHLSSEGDPARGESSWVVPGGLAAGAAGRVFVSAGAVGEQLVADPPVAAALAEAVLVGDGVFGPRFAAVSVGHEFPAAAILGGNRVAGRVVARRGNLCWVSRLDPGRWLEESVGLDTNGNLLGPQMIDDAIEGLHMFTRGGEGVPRGLHLGRPDQGPAPLGGTLAAVARFLPRKEG